jgi:predicted metal-binding membrane protein
VSNIFNIRSALWIAFFAAIAVAWSVMFMMANMAGVDLTGRPVGMNMMPMVTFGALFPMWAIMMAAMMLPTLVPTLRSYEDLMVSANGSRAGWSGVLLGYFIVWVGFAALIATAQVTLIAVGAVDALGIASSVWLAAALLIVVGLFQFSRAKEICHGVCHAPMMYFVGHWKTGFRGGLRMGLGLGAFCVGCCWGFMALGFVGGVMSLLWMGLATLFMILEKLPAVGHVVTKPMGVVLILAGIALPVWANL